MTKIDIISGFLGAGKTTLIKKLIAEALKGQKIVLIENEFGEIGIDGGFMKESGIQVNEMNSGCICCSLVGDFKEALGQVFEEYAPDRVIIEPSGVGKLSDVIKAVQGVIDGTDVVLSSHVTVADAKRARMYMKNFGEFYENQVQFAGAVILSRTQEVDSARLEKTVKLLRTLNEKSPFVTTPWNDITGEQILEVMEGKNHFEEELLEAAAAVPESEHHHEHGEHCHHDHDHEEHDHHDHDHEGHDHHDHDHEGHDHHDHDHEGHEHGHEGHHHADEIFDSWGRETLKIYTISSLSEILKKLADEDSEEYGTILRAKGFLPGEDGKWLHFDMVPGDTQVRYGTADYTGRLCVIGADLKEEKLAELFGL